MRFLTFPKRVVAIACFTVAMASGSPVLHSVADASGTHQHAHGAANGTPSAPLDVARDPADLPMPLDRRGPQIVNVDLESVEVTGRLADGATYHYWTFERKVPGPFIRVRVGDTVKVQLANPADSGEEHSIDLHAVTGPGGGGEATAVKPGERKGFQFKATKPGLYVYHCATPKVAQHIANGMYGLILVEPEGGLPKVDREFYIMQGEIYTIERLGSEGLLRESPEKLLAERPEYMVFNGTTTALKEKPLTARTGETIRIFFGVGGPNLASSFHVIGNVFDKVYAMGSVLSEPLRDVQTVGTPPGSAIIVDFKLEVPGDYVIVDHALSRVERGLSGVLRVEGAANPEVFSGG